MKDKLNFLFTSVGRRSYLIRYFKEALGNLGEIHVANSSEFSPAFQVADHSFITPIIYDDNYIPFLLDYCKKNDIKVIISLFDIDIPILSKNKKLFNEKGISVLVSDLNVVKVCNDKWNTYNFLIENGFKTAKTYISLDSALKAVADGEVKYPLIVKPRWGMGSISVFVAENESELRVFFDKTKRSIFETYLKYESAENVDECVIIQEKLCGQEHGMDVINDLAGVYQTTIVKQKYAMRSGETDCAVTVENKLLKDVGKRLGEILHHIGNLDVDVFVDGENVYILEMNARFGGGYPFSHMAGVNLPKAIILWLRGANVPADLLTEKIGVVSHKDIGLVRLQLNNH